MRATDTGTAIGTCFFEALSDRDYGALGARIAATATRRGVVPPGCARSKSRSYEA